MSWKIVISFGVVLWGLAQARPPYSEQRVKIVHHVGLSDQGGNSNERGEKYAWSYPSYEFAYKVSDPHTHDFKGQYEKREGDNVKGEYWLIEPSGRKRIVKYHVEKDSGFKAHIGYKEPKENQDEGQENNERGESNDGDNGRGEELNEGANEGNNGGNNEGNNEDNNEDGNESVNEGGEAENEEGEDSGEEGNNGENNEEESGGGRRGGGGYGNNGNEGGNNNEEGNENGEAEVGEENNNDNGQNEGVNGGDKRRIHKGYKKTIINYHINRSNNKKNYKRYEYLVKVHHPKYKSGKYN